MQRILLLSDIHANKVALKKVLEDARNIDKILCAGDIVDYNPWPLETIDLVKSHNIQSTMGNHDRDTALETTSGYNIYAETSCRWTHSQLSPDEQHYLLNLPKKLALNVEGVTLFICHGSPDDLVDEYVFPPPTTPLSILEGYLRKTQTSIVALGHTHIPFIQSFPEGHVVNSGSVGQPRSGDPRASYIIVTVRNGEVKLEHRLVKYEVDEVAAKIAEVGLPPFLAERLYLGV